MLRRSREVIAPGATLLAIDPVIPPGNAPSSAKLGDVFLLAVVRGGRDRMEAEFRTLLASAGFRLTRVVLLMPWAALLEAVP